MKKGFITGLLLFVFFVIVYAGATNFDRLVLGSGNYSTDPNTTADITFQNDEYIDNTTNGRLDFGGANLLTSGTIGGGVVTGTGFTIGSAVITEAELELLDGITGSGTLTTAELLFVDGVTSAIQTQLNAKQGTLTNSAGLLAALSDETGTGLAVFSIDPTFSNIVTVTDSLRSSNVSVLTGAVVLGNSLTGSALTRGTNAFTTTATADTVAVSGAGTGDIYVVSYIAAAAATEAPLSVVSTATGFIVTRPAGTTSAITYSWMRQK